MRFCKSLSAAAASLALLGAMGCATAATDDAADRTVTLNLHGLAYGGQQPISGATVKLYHVNVSTEKGASVSMTTGGAITTGTDGSFSITGRYTCGSATDVYLVISGGKPGIATANPNIVQMAALGQCSTLSSTTFVQVNELTTVAMIAAVAPFMASPTSIGTSSSSGETAWLDASFTAAQQFVNNTYGYPPGTNVPSGMSVPSALILTLGNILAACVNTSGVAAGDSPNCANLFSYATTPGTGVTAPTDTATAMMNILNHPTLNVHNLYQLAASSPPFANGLASEPTTLDVSLVPSAQTVTRTLHVFPDDGFSSIYSLVNNAATSIDMVMYGLKDTTLTTDLTNACARGVKVRVILDVNTEQSVNQAAYTAINAGGSNCSAVWANTQFQVTHEKSMVIDGATAAILTANLETTSYSGTRDFALIENDAQDVAAMEATFNQDYNSTTDLNYVASTGDTLVWSPTTAQTTLLSLINNATVSILTENEEMSAVNIVTALENACKRGVTVGVIMSDDGSYDTNLTAIKNASSNCTVRTYRVSASVLYIHAKVLVTDYGTSGAMGYLGSINYSSASMLENRELGTIVTDPAILGTLNTTLTTDYNNGTAY